jgi:hypothetical protein
MTSVEVAEVGHLSHGDVFEATLKAMCKRPGLSLAGLLTFAALLRLILFQGYLNSDPAGYAFLADELALGRLHLTDNDIIIWPLRFGIYAPAALMIRLFGLSEVTLAVVSFIISFASCVLIYIGTRHFFGIRAALISVALLAVLPIDVAMATTLFPDAIAAFWANLGVTVLLLLPTDCNTKSSVLVPIFAGLLFGISWLSKESVAYLAPFVAFYCLFMRHNGTTPLKSNFLQLCYVGVGLACVIVSEMTLYRIYLGDWFFHLHSIEANNKQGYVWSFDQASPLFGWAEGGYFKALVKRLLLTGPRDILISFAGLTFFAIISVAWSCLQKDRRFITVGVWFVLLVLMFNFGTSSLLSYKPLTTMERYLYPLLFPATILVSGALATLMQSTPDVNLTNERRFWACVLLVIYAVTCAHGLIELRVRPEQGVRDAASKLDAATTVYTDNRTAAALVFFRSGKILPDDSKNVPFENVAITSMKPGSYVLIDKGRVDFLTASYDYHAPAFVAMPPPSWTKVWADKKVTLYRVD